MTEWTETTVADAIEQSRHSQSAAWVFLRQVPNGTSNQKTHTADALAIGCWKSTGLEMHGYEIKISRGDWLREIQDHKKAEAFSRHCHYWWIATPVGIVKPEEMPANWGLVEVRTQADGRYGSRVKKAVTRNADPVLDYPFFAAALRKAKHDNPHDKEIKRLTQDSYNEGFNAGTKSNRDDVDRKIRFATQELRSLKESVEQFERLSGVSIRGWNAPENAAEAISHYLKDGHPLERLRELDQLIGRMKRDTEAGLKQLQEHIRRVDQKVD